MASEIESLMEYALQLGASELIVVEGAPSSVRMAGKVFAIPDAPAIALGTLNDFLGSLEGDSGSMVAGPWMNCKWRVRYYREAFGNAAVFRPLLDQCPDYSALGAPASLNNLLGVSSGLVVFGGPASSGKTTTASAYVSAVCRGSILRASFLNEKDELPIDTGESLVLEDSCGDVSDKMAQALRSGADLFWMGDFDGHHLLPMLQAAESGALVICNVTAGNTTGVLDALLSAVPDADKSLARTMLAAVLKSVVVQRLLPASDGKNVVPAWEILFNTQNVAAHIRAGEFFKLSAIMSAAMPDGMLTMDNCLADLVRSGYVTREEAEKYVSSAARLG